MLSGQDVGSRPTVIFLDCYDNKGRVPREMTKRSFLADCLKVRASLRVYL